MLKFSFLRSLASPIALPESDDQKLRRAFGRFAENDCRAEGAKVVSNYYGKNGCFHCDCRPDAERAPLLFLVTGNHIRREEKLGGKGTPHDDNCDFAYEADEQKRIVRSWLPFRKSEYNLKLVPDFGDTDDKPPSPMPSYVHTRSDSPKLARTLFNLLHNAHIDRFYAAEPLHGRHDEQIKFIHESAEQFLVGPGRPLSDWLATSLRDYYDLKKRLEERPAGWGRPYGLFIETFGKIEDKTLYPHRSDLKPIPITGDLAVYAEKDNLRRPPYLIIGSVTFPTRESKEVALYNVYAHPCFSWDRYTLVDSKLERETFEHLIYCRNRLAEDHGIVVTIEKPLFDLGPKEKQDAREVCKPDFVLRCRRKNAARHIVIIEAMGLNIASYRERKQRMRHLFENIKGGTPPHPVIEYDKFKPGMSPAAIDQQFRNNVCATIIKLCPPTD